MMVKGYNPAVPVWSRSTNGGRNLDGAAELFRARSYVQGVQAVRLQPIHIGDGNHVEGAADGVDHRRTGDAKLDLNSELLGRWAWNGCP